MIVVCNSGHLIALSKIKHLDILKEFFQEIIIPEAVWIEVVEKGKGRPGAKDIKESPWIRVKRVENKIAIEALRHEIGAGESEAIILAMELNADLVLIDEKKKKKKKKKKNKIANLGLIYSTVIAIIAGMVNCGTCKSRMVHLIITTYCIYLRSPGASRKSMQPLKVKNTNCRWTHIIIVSALL